MACQRSPTATEFTTITSDGVTTSFSAIVSSLPDSVSSSTVISCSTSGTNSSICVSSTLVATILGGLTTVQVPITIDAPVIVTQPTQTLFAPCENTRTSSTTFSVSQSTPPPTVITSQSSATGQDGSVIVQWVTVTSTLPPTPVWVPTVMSTAHSGQNGAARSVNLAPIIGGVLGGFFGLIGFAGLLWLFLRRRPSWGDISEANDQYEPETIRITRDRKRFELDMDTQPKPYQYGLVGQVNASTLGSPPRSPTSTLPTIGSQPPSWHGRQHSSLTPLLVNPGVSTPGPSMPTTASSRPSTAGSMIPLRAPSRPSTTNSMYPMRPPSQHGQYPSITKSAVVDEFGIRPIAPPSHSQNSSGWSKKSSSSSSPPPPLLVNLSTMNDPAPQNEDNGRGGSPVSFHEPRRPLQIVNAQISPTGSMSSSAEILQQPPEVGTSKLSSPLGPKGGQRRTSVMVANQMRDPDLTITTPGAPPAYEA